MRLAPVKLTATPSQTVGPFFHFGLAHDVRLGCLVREDTTGERIRVRIRVTDGDGVPVPDALLEVWQADADGLYVRPDDPAGALTAPAFCGFGRLASDKDGVCLFETIRPGRIVDAEGRFQASHINVTLFARGLLRQLYTRIYFEGDPDLARDLILSQVPAERRESLTARHGGGQDWSFDIRLQGERETVFFNL
jgi:protocatechuate 3,4-dioxygenase, alpha subunit